MKYYKLKPKIDLKECGSSPQLLGGVKYFQRTLIPSKKERLLIRQRQFKENPEYLKDIKPHPKAKYSDFFTSEYIGITYNGLFTSQRVVTLLEPYFDNCIQEFPIASENLPQKWQVNGISFINVIENLDCIDYSNSILTVAPDNNETVITDKNEFLDLWDKGSIVDYQEIKLLRAPEILMLPYGGGDILISEKIKDIIETSDITGYTIIPSHLLFR